MYITYLKKINQINGKALTLREIDVIACILSGKGTKTLSDFLKIAPKTFETHWQNIKMKLDIYSKENLVDIITKEGKRADFFNHFEMLCMEEIFFKYLEKNKENEGVELIHNGQDCSLKLYLDLIKKQLEVCGLKTRITFEKDLKEDTFFIKNLKTKESVCFSVDDLDSEPCHHFIFIAGILNKIDPEFIFDAEKFKSSSIVIKPISQNSLKDTFSNFNLFSRFKKVGIAIGLFFILSGAYCFYHFPCHKITIDEPFLSNFTKRKDLNKKIDLCLNQKDQISYCALIGLKGSGKTVLAKMYAKKSRASIVFELDAKSTDSLERSFFKLAYLLAKDAADREEIDFIKRVGDFTLRYPQLLVFVQKKLRSSSDWLLIFDNVLLLKDVENFIPKDVSLWGTGNVIFTSCNMNLSNIIEDKACVFVEELSNEEAFSIVKSKNNNLKQEEINDLLTKVPHFPLDVSLAASYIKESKITYESYKETLEKKVNKERVDILNDSFKSFLQLNDLYKDLFLFVSLFDFKNIPISLLSYMFSQDLVTNFVADLKKYSLVTDETQKDDDYYFSIHPFIHEQSLIYVKAFFDTNKTQRMINEKISFLINNVIKKRVLFSFHEASVPHMESLYQNLKALNIKNEKTDFFLHYTLGFAHYFGSRKLERSLHYFSQVVMSPLMGDHLSKQEERDILFILSVLYTDLGRGREAVKTIDKGLLLCEDESFKKAEFLSQKGYALSMFNNVEEPKNSFDQSMEILDKIEQDQKTKNLKSTVKGQLAALYGSALLTKDYDRKAVQYIDEAFLHLEYNHKLEKNIPRFVCYHLATLGHVYCNYGEFDKAMTEGLDKALYIIDHQLDGCPHYIIKLFAQAGVGECLLRSGKIKEANDLLKKVVSRTYDLKGDQFFPVYKAQILLMESYIRLDMFKEAEEELSQLLHFNVDGASRNILFAECLLHYNAGVLYQKKGCLEDSYRHFLIFFNKIKNFIQDEKLDSKIDSAIHFVKENKNLKDKTSKIQSTARTFLHMIYPMIDFV